MLLMGHQDVVPIEEGTESKWTEPPFSGKIADGFIWGRGTMDDKQTIVGVLEAVDLLLSKGFQPNERSTSPLDRTKRLAGCKAQRKSHNS